MAIANVNSNEEENHKLDGEKDGVKNMLVELSTFLGGAIVTALIGLVFGILTANRNRRNDAIKVFSVFIALKKSELDGIDVPTGWEKFYHDGKNELREAIFRIAPHLSKAQRGAFAEIWKEYKSGETYQKIRLAPSGGSDVLAYELEEAVTGIERPKSKEEIFHWFLDRMDKTANKGLKDDFLGWLRRFKF